MGEGTATVFFDWSAPDQLRLHKRPTDTVSDGTSTVTVNAGQPATFAGLTDGQAYTFSSVTSNACGSSSSVASPTFVPGVGPSGPPMLRR